MTSTRPDVPSETPVTLTGRHLAADAETIGALTETQRLMWLGQTLDAESPLYNMVYVHHVDGAIDPRAARAAWDSLVGASDTLRTIVHVEDGEPLRAVLPAGHRALDRFEIVDLRAELDSDAAAERWITERARVPIGLDRGGWDSALLQIGGDRSIWYFAQHHLNGDARSFDVIAAEMALRYDLALADRLDEAPPLPRFADRIERERREQGSSEHDAALGYWATKAQRPRRPTEWYGRTVTGRSTRTDRLVVQLDPARANRLREIASSEAFRSISADLSMYAIWTTLVAVLAHRLAGVDSIRLGSPYAARTTADERRTIGLFIEVGVVDAEVRPDDTFASLAGRFRDEVLAGLRHVRPGITSAALNRSYDLLVNYVRQELTRFGHMSVDRVWHHSAHGDANHSLRVQVVDEGDSGSLTAYLDVATEVFGPDEQCWLLQQFHVLLDRFTEDPERAIGSFDLLSADERRRFVDEFNDTHADYDRNTDVASLVAAQANRTPDAPAVTCGDETWSYRQLDRRIDTLAAALQEAGVGPRDRVAVSLGRSADAVATFLAVTRAGGAWIPVDPAYPVERRRAMIADAEPALIVTRARGTTSAAADDPAVVSDIATLDPGAIDPGHVTPATVKRDPDQLAYMIYTSGSTGTPKATMLTDAGLVDYLTWAGEQYVRGDRLAFALYSSLSFDLTITSMFLPLVTGGSVDVVPESAHGDGLEILDVFDEDRVDVVKLTPAHLALVLERGVEAQRIARLILGGEDLRTDLARAFVDAVGRDVEIFNEYGPTEAVVGCMVHRFDPAQDRGRSVPIGVPAANTAISVVDRYDHPVPSGVIGEMVVESDGVALGYWRRDELTAARFEPSSDGDPHRRRYRTGDLARWGGDGRIQFLGRDDDQVKIRGARVELGEIEAAMAAHPGVDLAVVDVSGTGTDSRSSIQHCARCGAPSNLPGIDLDEQGACSDCRAFARHHDDVARYFGTPDDLRQILDRQRGRRSESTHYDGLVLVSGGKDSTYMLYRLVREFGVHPLVFLLDNGFIAESAIDNVRNACNDLEIDLHIATTPHMNDIFVDSLKRHANVCDGCYKTIYTLSLKHARDLRIPSIITGLARGQLFETRLGDTFAIREFEPAAIDTWIDEARRAYHRIDDVVTERLNGDLFDDDSILDEVEFVDFYRYVDVGLDDVYEYLTTHTVWQRPPDTGRSTNCLINDVGIHVHNTVRGFHNYAMPYSWDVRLGHKARSTAMDELDDDIDLGRVREILDEIGWDEPIVAASDQKRLVAYYTSSAGLEAAALREHLDRTLPEYLRPSQLIALDTMPLTMNGKVDRAALPSPTSSRPELASRYVAPRTHLERELVDLWAEVIGVDDVGVHDDFFELGGDSITCVRLVSLARTRGIDLTTRHVFEGHTIARAATRLVDAAAEELVAVGEFDHAGGQSPVDADRPASSALPSVDEVVDAIGADVVSPADIEDILELTPTQLGMLFHCVRDSDPSTYVGVATCRFGPELDVDRWRSAWTAVIGRHPAARTHFVRAGFDEPVQVVRRDLPLRWEEHDWSEPDTAPGHDVEQRWEALVDSARREGIPIDSTSLSRFVTVRTPTDVRFLWVSHHAALDGWSAQLLHRQAIEAYLGAVQDPGRGPEGETTSFAEHVDRVRSLDVEAEIAWWADTLADVDVPTPLAALGGAHAEPLPTDGPSRHFTVRRPLGAELSDAVTAAAKRHRVTPGTLITSAWALVTGQHADLDEVVIGTTVSGRDDATGDVAATAGMYLTTVPLRVRIDERAVGRWLRDQQISAFDARSHGEIGLADIQRSVSLGPAEAMFSSIVVIENHPGDDGKGTGLARTPLTVDNPSNFPLAILVHPGDDIRIDAVLDAARVDRAAVQSMIDHLVATIGSLTAHDDLPVRDLPLVAASEIGRIRSWERGDEVDFAPEPVHDLISRQALQRPDAVAVTSAGRSLDYASLDRAARAVAAQLSDQGVRPGDRVGVVSTTDARVIAAILGVLRAGAAYVPFEPETPAARLAHIVDEAGLRVICGIDDSVGPIVSGLRRRRADADLVGLDLGGIVDEPDDVDPSRCRPVDPASAAYVIYTSGSTGLPKGVEVRHSSLSHSTTIRDDHYGRQVGSFLVVSALSFDSSLVGIFWTLVDGGTVVLPAPGRRRDVGHLADLVERHRVTHLLALPSLYGVLLDEIETSRLSSLRTVIVAGEACSTSVVERHCERAPDRELWNEYGPTEGTVWSHGVRLDDRHPFEGPSAPIGRPVPNTYAVLLDRFGRRVPVGVNGELVLGGPGIASGYVGRPDLTDGTFVRLPALDGVDPDARHYRTGDRCRWRSDGLLEFVGRRDGQVKLRGHRIELAEVEAVLESHPSVVAAAAIVTDAEGNGRRPRLVAWLTPPAHHTVDPDEIRQWLSVRVPEHMVPADLVEVDTMPRTSTGKIDRSRLIVPARSAERSGDVDASPVDALERELIDIWSDVLGQRDIGVDDDFFDLGGNSLDAMRVFARIERRIGRDLRLDVLFGTRTVRALASELRVEPPVDLEDPTSVIVPIEPGGDKRPFFYVGPHQISILELGKIGKYFDPDRPFYGLRPPGLGSGEAALDTIEDIAERFVDAVIAHQPHGPYLIGGHCDGSWTAHLMARRLVERGHEVAYVALVDLPPPHEDFPTMGRLERIVDRLRYYRRDGRLWHAIAFQLKQRFEVAVLLRFGGAAAGRERATRLAHTRAFDAYQIEHHDAAPLHLVRSTELAVMMDEIDWYDGLAEGSNRIEVTDISSTHARLLMEPETEELAAVLGRGLDAAGAG